MTPTPTGAGRPTKSAARPGALAAGAARASGERARRRSTPLVGDASVIPEAVEAPAAPAVTPTHRPTPVVRSGPTRKAVAKSGGRRSRTAAAPKPAREATDAAPQRTRPTRLEIAARRAARPERPLRAVADPPALDLIAEVAATSSRAGGPGLEELIGLGVTALRAAAVATGLSPEQVEAQVAATLAYLRRRLEGDYTVDEFGFDSEFTDHVIFPMLRPLYRKWFRVEVRGIENIPTEGGALVVANHSGTVAIDSIMTQLAIHDEHPDHRYLRMLGADLVFQTPYIGTVARRTGSTLAANPNAERLLQSGELVGVWPEGFKGVGKPFSERYKLQRFGRGGFVSAALRSGVPIIPCSIVGAEEIYPLIGNIKPLARLLGMPYLPITPTFPLLGPLGLVPLPSKWLIEFGKPVDTASLGPAAADDPMVVFDLTDQVRETIQQTLYSLLMQRRSVFF